jgi:hypothetical protein
MEREEAVFFKVESAVVERTMVALKDIEKEKRLRVSPRPRAWLPKNEFSQRC